jgi:hypothetical protein
MRKNKLILIAMLAIPFSTFFTSCKKSKDALAPVEAYKLIGKLDVARTTVPTAVLTKAEFTVSYNNPNSFDNAQSLLSGTLTLTGFNIPVDTITTKGAILDAVTGLPVSPADSNVTRSFLANNFDFFGGTGINDISYISVVTSKTVTYKTSTTPGNSSGLFGNYTNAYYTYNNNPSASFTVTNMPFTNDITSILKEGKGYIRLGKAPKYVYILLDNVTKL